MRNLLRILEVNREISSIFLIRILRTGILINFARFLKLFKTQFLDLGTIKSDKVAEVMKETDRKFYCHVAKPYIDRPYSIGCGATISAPHIHADALEMLGDKLTPDATVLDGKKLTEFSFKLTKSNFFYSWMWFWISQRMLLSLHGFKIAKEYGNGGWHRASS